MMKLNLKFNFKKEPKIVKPKTKLDKLKTWANIVTIITSVFIVCIIAGLVIMVLLLKDKPTVDINDFISPESSKIYDKNGEIIAELGMTIRENVTYDELPNSLVDAFVSVEDSRFFEHNGFDVPRFTKALLENIRTLSFGQGGSTFTMQLVKNTYFVDDEAGINAPKKLSRKAQEIFSAMQLENLTNKKTILELYLNKLNFGGSRNIRGIEKAAEYYFGKEVSEINLAESALLAGVINAPNLYNPFNNLEAATKRRDTVLYLMKYHGYISETDYKLAVSIKVEDLLVNELTSNKKGTGTAYQAYIDAVVNEVYELTGSDAYSVTMDIYTAMDKEVQTLMDEIQAGIVDEFEYPDDEYEVASIAVNNKTGEIIGVLGGRNYANGGALLLNHAIDQYKQPGSSIKPIIDYAPAFENLGWSTSHVVVDKPITYPGTSIVISNANGKYSGQVTLKTALGNSLNIPAILTLEEVVKKIGVEKLVEYMNNMGFDQITTDNYNIQFGIGGGDLTVSCKQMAAAQATIMNYGEYNTPHCITKIEYKNGKNPVTPVYKSTEAMSSASAYLTAELLYSNIHNGYANLMSIFNTNYATYAKTGTTDWGTSGRDYDIPDGSIKDSWTIASSPDFTIATWTGYEKAQVNKQSYIKLETYLKNIQGKITKLILDETVESYGKPESYKRPDDVVSIQHILGTYPYASVIEGMDEKYIANGYIAKKYYSLVSPETATIESMTSKPTISCNNSGDLSITWPVYPDADKLNSASETMDISLRRSDGSAIIEAQGQRLFDYSFIFGAIKYKAVVTNSKNETILNIVNDTNTYSGKLQLYPGDSIKVCTFYGYQNKNINSNQECQDIKISDISKTFTLPAETEDINVIKTQLQTLGFNVVVAESATIATKQIASNSSRVYQFGQTYSVNASEIARTTLTITCPSVIKQIRLTCSTLSVSYGETIEIVLNPIGITDTSTAVLHADPEILIDTAVAVDFTDNKYTLKIVDPPLDGADTTISFYVMCDGVTSNTLTINVAYPTAPVTP